MFGYHHTIDYINTSFENPILDKIHGKPTFSSLNRLKKQLKANAQSVVSDLGGGAHGHLGLVLSPAEYQLVSNTPYDMPNHPGPFSLPRNTDAAEAIRRREAHQERVRKFRESLDIKKALIKQIVAAIDKAYLEELRDETTNTITKTIPEILTYLFTNFADVTSDEVNKEEEKVVNHFWNLSDPPMSFYTLIEDLQLLSTAAKIPRTNEQLVALGVNIIQKTGDLETALMQWFEKDTADQTWSNFKTHFSNAHRSLRKVRGKEIKNTPFHQANSIAQRVDNNLSDLRNELRDTMTMLTSVSDSSTPFHSSASVPMSSISHTANSVTNAEILKLVMQLQQQILDMGKEKQAVETKKPKSNFIRNQVHKYCWTHGACGHESRQCKNKKEGHRDEATFSNRLGGSDQFCKPVKESNTSSDNTL